jgi:hypothetical protein
MVAKCYLVGVLPATVKARAEDTGIYTVGWWIPQGRGEQRVDQEKKFVPEIHEFHPTSPFGSLLTKIHISQLEQ